MRDKTSDLWPARKLSRRGLLRAAGGGAVGSMGALADGALALSSRRSARFSGEMWLRRNGQDVPAPWPGDSAGLRCDGAGCIYRAKGQVVALVRDSRALADDCRVADVVMSAVPVRRPCPSAQVVVDRIDLWRGGAHALYLEANGVRVESGADYGAALADALAADRTTLIDVVTDPEAYPPISFYEDKIDH